MSPSPEGDSSEFQIEPSDVTPTPCGVKLGEENCVPMFLEWSSLYIDLLSSSACQIQSFASYIPTPHGPAPTEEKTLSLIRLLSIYPRTATFSSIAAPPRTKSASTLDPEPSIPR